MKKLEFKQPEEQTTKELIHTPEQQQLVTLQSIKRERMLKELSGEISKRDETKKKVERVIQEKNVNIEEMERECTEL